MSVLTSESTNERSVAIEFQKVCRYFGELRAVDHVDLTIRDGEFFSMLGPSGSGKTTCLRLIAGFDQPTSGSIQLYGQELAGVPPFLRDVNTVFQDYALFPHMTIGENVGYGLMVKGVPRAERLRRVREMLELVQLPGVEKRKPSQLSGGQRQRIALARALINQPKVLLLDEPLGALDLKLRQQMQVELKAIQHRLGITFVFVTHDQEEALSMSDRIAVFNKGQIEQIGTPDEIYDRPTSTFVANFVGTSNLFTSEQAAQYFGISDTVAIRPEKIHLLAATQAPPTDARTITGTVREVSYLGVNTRFDVTLPDGRDIIVLEQNFGPDQFRQTAALRGQPVTLVWRSEDLRILAR